jgi:hypothetical protein
MQHIQQIQSSEAASPSSIICHRHRLARMSGYNKYTVKKLLSNFPSPAGMSLPKLSLAGNNLINLGQRKFVQ